MKPRRHRPRSTSVNAQTRSWLHDLRSAAPAILCFVITRWLILFQLTPIGSDIGHYFEYTVLGADMHRVAYSDSMPIEFPTVAWWVISGVRVLGGETIPEPIEMSRVVEVRAQYFEDFRRVMCAADVAAFAFVMAILRRRRSAALGITLLAYALSTALLGHVLYDRLDIVLLLLLLVWAYCWLRSSIDRSPVFWHVAAYVGLGLAVSYKLVPVVVVPFVLLADGLRTDRWKRLAIAASTLVLSVGLPLAVQYAVSGRDAFRFLTYQGERGIEIESIWASIMAAASVLGIPIATTISHGAVDLVGPLAAPMKMASTIGLAAMVGGLWLFMLRRGASAAPVAAFRFGCLAVAGAVAVANVLSVQFLVWALPMLLLVIADVVATNTRALLVSAALVVLVAALTTWVFPYHFFYLGDTTPYGLVPMGDHRQPLPPSPVPFIVLGLRNVTYFGLTVWAGWRLVRSS